ncbi:MAG TPA: 4'-phosphopantetheinyl transferase superfamily protein [Jatrophihabitans sp.]|nr:4'-phosphopantetheinyl transferase superfamily protein [Jatrophihabitans sp.]
MTDLVSIWLIRTGQPEPVVNALTELLDSDELFRAGQIAEVADRAEFVVSHGAVRTILARTLGVPASLPGWRLGPHGKPELAVPDCDLQCNLSHSGGLAVFAVCAGRAVGVDVQCRQFGSDLGQLAARYYPADEARFVTAARSDHQRAVRFTGLWSRKEACVKAGGGRLIPGLAWPARGVDPSLGAVPVTGADGHYLVRDLIGPPGFHLAVALAGTAPFRVRRTDWSAAEYLPSLHQSTDPMAVDRC